jgi:hypothetical protein
MRVQREDRRWICILVIDIDFFANQARPMAMDYAISNGFGWLRLRRSQRQCAIPTLDRRTDRRERRRRLMIDALRSDFFLQR